MSAYEDDNIDDSDKGERKRQREKQRRSELASAFEELQMTINIIEPGSSRSTSAEPDTGAPSTRLDLVRKTTETLRRVHSENLELRRLMGSGKGGETIPQPTTVSSSWAPDPAHASYPGQQHPPPDYYPGFRYQHQHAAYYRGYQPQHPAGQSLPERGYAAGYPECWDGHSQQAQNYDEPPTGRLYGEPPAGPL